MAILLSTGVVLVATAVGLIPSAPLVRVIAGAALLAFFGIVIFGLRRFQRIAVDMGELVDAAERIEAGDYGVQVSERGPREARTLIRTFNAMSARLAIADRNRRAFVADLTHELRTPLAIIRGQAEAIGDGVYPGDDAHVRPILDAAQTLETLVEALPTLTLADVGGLQLHREQVDVGVLIGSSVASFQAMADGTGVHLKSEIPPGLATLNADPVRLRSVLLNLLSNAIRHTAPGGLVEVFARGDSSRITIGVRDNGEGIPPDLRRRVFDRFVKGSRSPGAGLGLAISKDIVAAHGGTIALDSEPGKGTEVQFTLPVRPGIGR